MGRQGIRDRVAIIGVGYLKFGESWEKNAEDLLIEAVYNAYEDAGIKEPQDEIDAGWVGIQYYFTGLAGSTLADYIKLYGKPMTRVENFCASGMDAFRNAANAVAAGTADISVAEEAAVTAETMGNEVLTCYDVGVAGLHRLLSQTPVLRSCSVVIAVAGMEGALPSVVGGLVEVPVIAVPTSVGYGASFDGLAALLGMLNSCSSNVTVVNIDNGFGAGYVASLINRKRDFDAT